MNDLRTKKSHNRYVKLISKGILADGCNLCKDKESVKKFKHWRIITALYPWDLITKTHHMIIPKRHITYKKLNAAEKKEFDLIKSGYIEKTYDLIAEAPDKKKSIPGHLHVHLLMLKD
jgi:hypothetical protein